MKSFAKVIPLSLHDGIANKITAVSDMIRTYYLHKCFGGNHAPPFLQNK